MITFSWDDGHPEDLRLAELFGRYGISATFYIPCSNREGLPVLNPAQIRSLRSAGFTLGSHTYTHCYLTSVPLGVAIDEIRQGKEWLQDCIGEEIEHFCYPGGKYNERIVQAVREAGFASARTIRGFYREEGTDPFRCPTTLQFYPHSRRTLSRNFVSGGDYRNRFPAFLKAIAKGNLGDRITSLCSALESTQGPLHFWGHSYELGGFGGWRILEDFLRRLAHPDPIEPNLGCGQ